MAGGIRNTHSQYGDRRMEILTEIAESITAGRVVRGETVDEGLSESLRRDLSACVTTDDAVRILRERKLDQPVLAEMTRRIRTVMEDWTRGRMQVGVIVFSNVYGELGRTENALEFMQILRGLHSCHK